MGDENGNAAVEADLSSPIRVTRTRAARAPAKSPTKRSRQSARAVQHGASNNIEDGRSTDDPDTLESNRRTELELRRRQIEEERLRKQKEMEALLAEEEALLEQESVAVDEDMAIRAPHASSSADYETRSETEGDPTQEELSGEHAEFLSGEHQVRGVAEMDKEDAADEAVDLYGHMVSEDHYPEESELASRDPEEDSNQTENSDGANEGGGGIEEKRKRKKAISPVTWDVDVHATAEDQLSVDSPLHSDDESEDGKEPRKPRRSSSAPSQASVTDGERTGAASVLSNTKSDQVRVPEAEDFRPRLHKYLYREAKYFMVKSNNHENVRLARAKGVWSTPPQNQIKFNNAVSENTTVILVFSVKESGNFQGFARINGPSTDDGPRIAWVLPPGISARALSGVFKLDWISRTDLSFDKTMHLRNPWNEHKPVKIARDGQEIEPRVGEEICKLFTLDGSSDYERVISRIKRKREALTAKGVVPRSHRPVQPVSRGRGRGGPPYRGPPTRGPPPGGYRDAPYRPRDARERIDPAYSRGPPSHHPPPDYYPSYPPSDRYPYGSSYDTRNVYERPSYPPPPQPVHSVSTSYQHPVSSYPTGVSTDIIAKGSYDDYLNELRRSSGYLPHDTSGPSVGYDDYHPSSRNPPPAPIPSRDSRPPSRRSYDRQVDDFLRRTTSSSARPRSDRERRRDDRRDDRRERSRSRDRYRDRR